MVERQALMCLLALKSVDNLISKWHWSLKDETMVLIVADLKVYINSSKFNVALAKFVYMDRLTFPLNVFEMPQLTGFCFWTW